MPKTTQHARLTMPLKKERYNVEVFNENNLIIDKHLKDIQDVLFELQDDLTKINEDITGIQDNIPAELQTTIDSLTEKINKAQDSITKANLDELKENINQLKSDMTQAKNDIGSIQGNQENAINDAFSKYVKKEEVINDLTTGGTDVPLSASQGVELNKKIDNHTHSGYAPTSHTHSGYATENHTHSNYATTAHNHDTVYAPISHTHPEYGGGAGGGIESVLEIYLSSSGVDTNDGSKSNPIATISKLNEIMKNRPAGHYYIHFLTNSTFSGSISFPYGFSQYTIRGNSSTGTIVTGALVSGVPAINAYGKPRFYIRDIKFQVPSATYWFNGIADIYLGNVVFDFGTYGSGSAHIVLFGESELTIENVSFTWRSYPGASPIVVYAQSSSKVRVGTVKVTGYANAGTIAFKLIGATTLMASASGGTYTDCTTRIAHAGALVSVGGTVIAKGNYNG